MTDRDTFAAAALTGLLSRNHAVGERDHCFAAYQWADAMLAERERTTEKNTDVRDSRNAKTTNHDAAPAARAPADRYVRRAAADGESDRTDKAAPRPSEGTGDTPVTDPMPKAPTGSGSVTPDPYSGTDENRVDSLTKRDTTQPRNGALDEPVAWAVVCGDCVDSLFADRDEAVEWSCGIIPPPHIVPLYRQSQDWAFLNDEIARLRLTDEERKVVASLAALCEVSAVVARSPHMAATLRGMLERLK